ncbi:MAG: nitronate monooxygenase [Acidimicrobiia bacterium]|nr:MAG: nitronate monooxygenase [Acidimicrobiia bacterium]
MYPTNELLRRLSMQHPIIQAPMAGGADTPALVAGVGEAGGFGFIGAAYLSPERTLAAAAEIRSRTSRPFGVNLFAPLPVPELPDDADLAVALIAPFYAEIGLDPPTVPDPPIDDFGEKLEAAVESGASALSFTFGLPPPEAMVSAKRHGLVLIGTATTVDEGRELQAVGVDAVVAQGSEAGGHRGTFASAVSSSLVGTMALVPQMVDALEVPVIASGGIMDGRGIAAALALGAEAVQMGTAFLTTDEAGAADVYREAILDAGDSDTQITTAFSGRAARGIVNRVMTEIDADGAILPFPYQNALTRPLRSAATSQNDAEYLSLWAGQGVGMARTMPAGELMARLVDETHEAVRRLSDLYPD